MGRYTALFNRLCPPEVSNVQNAILNRQSCHQITTLHCSDCGKEWVTNLPCGDKLCVECAYKRSRKNHYVVFAILCSLGLLSQAHRLRRVTLTIKNVSSVSVGYAKLRRCFGILQHRSIWCNAFYGRKNKNGKRHRGWNVRGGCGNFETTNIGNGYHVHLHLFLDCDFMPKAQLSKLWHEITGDSYIVDVLSCSGTKEALYEVTKYPFKPADVVLWSDTMKLDFNSALHNKVLFFRFGSWRKVKYFSMPDKDCPSFVSYSRIGKRVARCPFCNSTHVWALDFEDVAIADAIRNPILVYGGGADYG